ncbi:hypothetical protein BHR42_22360 [Aeromonas salmonicida subsp. salmonicida]|nr:hypothetical protein BHR42_22360 [Aeromonas salmonicida subsp. salmonicida]
MIELATWGTALLAALLPSRCRLVGKGALCQRPEQELLTDPGDAISACRIASTKLQDSSGLQGQQKA